MARTAEYWDTLAEHESRLAEQLAHGLLDGADTADALHAAAHRRDVYRDAAALARYRRGDPVLCWPTTAPWAGF